LLEARRVLTHLNEKRSGTFVFPITVFDDSPEPTHAAARYPADAGNKKPRQAGVFFNQLRIYAAWMFEA
jgi:hypothetical protein